MFKLLIKPIAEFDATDAANWYNFQREGLGEEFLLALEAKLNEIQRNPNQFNTVYKNVKRAFLKRFPFGVFFITEGDIIFILSIYCSYQPESQNLEKKEIGTHFFEVQLRKVLILKTHKWKFMICLESGLKFSMLKNLMAIQKSKSGGMQPIFKEAGCQKKHIFLFAPLPKDGFRRC